MRWLLVAVGCTACGRGFFNPMPAQHDAPIAGTVDAAAPPIAFVQGTVGAAASSSIDVTVPLAQHAGNTNLVVVFWEGGNVTQLYDTAMNSYATAIGPISGGNNLTQSVYYATNIAAGQNSIHAELSAAPLTFGVAVFEYAGVDPVHPIDIAVGANGMVTPASSGELDLVSDGDLVWAAIVTDAASSQIPGFTLRENSTGLLVEDQQVASAGTYAAITGDALPGNWVCEAIGLRR